MTVSYFLKRSSTRSRAVTDAIIYGLSIIAVYVALGLVITLAFGANALNALSTNAIVNIIFFIMLVVFALSFFGLFEITLPSGWSTGTDRKSVTSGLGGIFFMALTLTIVSFSCTGPIIGFLLVDAASTGNILAPTIGMLGFSVAMAIPFTLFALFPGWLHSLPKSGGWMDHVKVTLGFIELAFSLKFLSVADMAYGWGILPRDLFILLWILMALLLGIYLIRKHSRVTGLITGIASLAFAASLIPGLWGAPLKAISAFTPPMSTQIFGRNNETVEPQFTDYNEAIQASGKTGKPILIDFTGYGCVNCRKMEASVWTDPRVSEVIREKYILVSLFVDDKTPLGNTVTIDENGTNVRIRTIGDKWSLLQRHKFGANAQPFYVIIDSQGRLIKGPYTFDPDADHFVSFLLSRV
jgi:thiol:disulfide interchange protein DsbD